MSGIYIPGDNVPTKCVGCSFRDPEYGGSCILMPSFDADTYEEQFDRCPFKELRKRFGSVPDHGRLIDADALAKEIEYARFHHSHTDGLAARHHVAEYGHFLKALSEFPTIIPAAPAEEGE